VDFAREFARRGYDLALVARREGNLHAVASEISARHGRRVEVFPADLSVESERERLAAQVSALDRPLEVLVNNAGLGLYGEFAAIPWDKERRMLEVDIAAVVHLCKLLVPGMRERRCGYVLNVASIGAFQPTPLYASYCAAKAFVLSFSQALNYELRGSGVSVTVVSPGVAATEFLAVSKQEATPYQRLVRMSSAAVVRDAVNATMKRRAAVVPGFVNAATAFATRFTPPAVLVRMAYALMKSNDPAH